MDAIKQGITKNSAFKDSSRELINKINQRASLDSRYPFLVRKYIAKYKTINISQFGKYDFVLQYH